MRGGFARDDEVLKEEVTNSSRLRLVSARRPWHAGASRLGATRTMGITLKGTLRVGRAYAKMRVLVVDDDPSIRALLGMALASEGLVTYMACDGEQALEVVRTSPSGFDVVLLDLDMPVMDGRAFYREFRADHPVTPVVLLSAYGAKQAQRELGTTEAIDKPFDPFELVERVKELGGAIGPSDGTGPPLSRP